MDPVGRKTEIRNAFKHSFSYWHNYTLPVCLSTGNEFSCSTSAYTRHSMAQPSIGMSACVCSNLWPAQRQGTFDDDNRDQKPRTLLPLLAKQTLERRVEGLSHVERYKTLSHSDHLVYNINAGNAFCYGVFHLQPCVHFQEEEVLLRIHQEFHRSYTKYNATHHLLVSGHRL